jgi:hypothetical protein
MTNTQDLRRWIEYERQYSLDRLDELVAEAVQQGANSRAVVLLDFKRIAADADVQLSSRMTRCAGKAFPQRKLIKISTPLFCATCNADVAEHQFRMTYRHELAHLLCACRETLVQRPGYYDNGHGATWRNVCRMIGGNGARTHKLKLTHNTTTDTRPMPPRVSAPRRNDGLDPLRKLLSF